MSEPKPTWTIGTNEFDTDFVAKWSGTLPADQPDPTYITALNLRIDALCDEVGRLRAGFEDVKIHMQKGNYLKVNAIVREMLE